MKAPTKMKSPTKASYVTREEVLGTLSDAENAAVANAETEERLPAGEAYLDLAHLELGVRYAQRAAHPPMHRVLPQRAVQEVTWGKIMKLLPHAVAATTAETLARRPPLH